MNFINTQILNLITLVLIQCVLNDLETYNPFSKIIISSLLIFVCYKFPEDPEYYNYN